MDKFISQKSVYMVKLDGICSEQKGERLFLILSSCICNQYSDVVVGVPLTTKMKNPIPTHHLIYKEKYPQLKADSIILGEQIRAISKQRIGKFVFKLDLDDFQEVITKTNINFRIYD